MIEKDVRYTVERISESLSINSRTVLHILKQNLRRSKICACWVPHLLSQSEKELQAMIASELLAIYDGCDEKCLFKVITGAQICI